MSYLARNPEPREDPKRLLAGAKSIIAVAMNYRREDDAPTDVTGSQHSAVPETTNIPGASAESVGRVARYARGRDYHVVLRERLTRFEERIREILNEPLEARICVDTAPLLEREIANRAGLGWIGKNTCLLHHEYGSYLFLGELITTLELAADSPIDDHCGTCTRCLEACPTRALVAPYRMDATRCIAYWNIEHRGEIPAEIQTELGDWLYGCDICQEVCPFNARAPLTPHAEFRETRVPGRIPLTQLIPLRSSTWKRMTAGSAAARATRRMWQRNAQIVAENLRRRDATLGSVPPDHVRSANDENARSEP